MSVAPYPRIPQAGGIRRGAPPPLPPPLPRRRGRGGWVVLALAAAAGFGGLAWAQSAGEAAVWNKLLIAWVADRIAEAPLWLPRALADLAVLGGPTLLAAAAALAALRILVRDGVGAALGGLLMVGLGIGVLVLLKLPFLPAGTAVAGTDAEALLTAAGFPSAPVFCAVLLWGWLLGVMPAGVVLGLAVGAARVGIGADWPMDAAAGACAALATLALMRWLSQRP